MKQFDHSQHSRHRGNIAARVIAGAMLVALAGCGQSGGSASEATKAEQAKPEEVVADAEDAGKISPAERAARSTKGDGDAAYHTDLPLAEFMGHVMQYAGDGIWKRQGYIIDKAGEHSLYPKNDKEWEDAESASLALAEMTNVLLVPGRRVPEPGWDNAVEGVRKVALEAAAAAEKKDPNAFFVAGGDLDEACDACHTRYDPKFKPEQVR